MFFPTTGNAQVDAAFDEAFVDAFAGRNVEALRKALKAACDMSVSPEREGEKRRIVEDMRRELAALETSN
jgi:hypothetical protein